MKYASYNKVKMLFYLIAFWLLSSCGIPSPSSPFVESQDLLVDSVVFSRQNDVPNYIISTPSYESVFEKGDSICMYDVEQLVKTNEIHSVNYVKLDISESADYEIVPYYDIHTGKFRFLHVKNWYFIDDEYYALSFSDNRSIVSLSSDTKLAHLFKYSDKQELTQPELAELMAQTRVGLFKTTTDTLELFDSYQQQILASYDPRFVMCLPISAQSKQGYFLGYTFLDTIYHYSFSGSLKEVIPLPPAIKASYYSAHGGENLTTEDFTESQLYATQYMIAYNSFNNTLNVITILPHTMDEEALFQPEFGSKGWCLSAYDLDKRTWMNHIRFSPEHDYLSIVYLENDVLVKRKNQNVLDKFKIY